MTLTDSARSETLSTYMSTAWSGDARYEGLDAVMAAIAEGAQQIQQKVQAATLAGVIGTTGETNVQGEIVQLLDTAASDTFVDVLSGNGRVAAIGCEEIDDTVVVGDGPRHSYIVQMDPLDGSSNIDVAVSIGSIFGIWSRRPGEPVSDASLLRPGKEQVAAAYVVYGSSTVMVMAIENSVQGFTLDPTSRQFALTHPDLRLPDKCSYYSANEGNFKKLDGPTRKAITTLRDTYSLRYVGSLVADIHRNLLKGGIFLYPGDPGSPDGKLRLMYEANPLGFVVEQAGGAASSGARRILDIQPERLHQRTPLIIGNKDVVDRTVSIIGNG
jgi:fructose-1,6-bisphosphatase I